MLALWRKRQHELMCIQLNARMVYETGQMKKNQGSDFGRFNQLEAVPGLRVDNSGNSKPFGLQKPTSIKAVVS